VENEHLQLAASFHPQDANSRGVVNASDASPITPVADKSWTILRILLALLVIAGLMYFFLRR
jgi:hypothetical protein